MPYFEHRQPVDAHAEGEALPDRRVDAGGGQHLGVDHAGAEDLEPVVALADPELAAGEGAADVDLGRGLGEGEVAGAELELDAVDLEEGAAELLEHPLQVGHGDVAVDGEALDLVEHRRVGLVVVGAVDPAGGDDAAGDAVRLHVADLHRRGVGAEHVRRAVVAVRARHVEGVVLLPGRVLGRDVEGVEVVPVALDLGALGDGEAEVGEDGGDLVHHLADRVDGALGDRARRQGDVGPFAGDAGLERGVGEAGAGLGQGLGEVVLERVERGAGGLARLGRHGAEAAHEERDLALLAEGGEAHLLERRLVGGGVDGGQVLLAQAGDVVQGLALRRPDA